jgi:hypothetical protein
MNKYKAYIVSFIYRKEEAQSTLHKIVVYCGNVIYSKHIQFQS